MCLMASINVIGLGPESGVERLARIFRAVLFETKAPRVGSKNGDLRKQMKNDVNINQSATQKRRRVQTNLPVSSP